MKFIIINLMDDNFGDMLIRISFRELLKVALKNLGYTSTDYCIAEEDLRNISEETLSGADAVFFGGGGMVDFGHLKLGGYVESTLELADRLNIPVVMSSIGINNFGDKTPEEIKERFNELFSHKCLAAVSVRENLDLFRKNSEKAKVDIELVSDPAVWTEDIYRESISDITADRKNRDKPLIGVNVVRGGLFENNGGVWKRKQEREYLNELINALTEQGYDYRFYTNGMSLDDNAMIAIAEEIGIEEDKLIKPRTTEEFVKCAAMFDAIAAIRLHSSIVAYSMNIPSFNLVWNDKIPSFYSQIGYPERIVYPEENAAATAAEMIVKVLKEGTASNPEYKMTVYHYIFKTVGKLLGKDVEAEYSYEQVKEAFTYEQNREKDNNRDIIIKLDNLEKRYVSLFKADNEKKSIINKLEKNIKKLEDKYSALNERYKQLNSNLVVKGIRKLQKMGDDK